MIATILGVLLLIAFGSLVSAVVLLMSLLIVRVPKLGFQQIYTCSIVSAILWLVACRAIYGSYERGVLLRTLAVIAVFAAVAILPPILLRIHFHTSWIKSVGASFLWVLGTVGIGLVSIVCTAVVTQRAYVIPTNGMAPTINGSHRVGRCKHCDGQAIVSAPAGSRADGNVEGICSSCWRFGPAEDISPTVVSGDRILASPFLKPNRWDIVTFHPPADPEVLYVQRIVGLPGESVLIKNGQICINGTAQNVPPELEHLTFAGREELSSVTGSDYGLKFGVGDEPCQLQADECFVLGDNTFRSSDSRFFGPVKMDQVTGVVTTRYWPPSRLKVLRDSGQPLR
ncbi:MAG: signal peptidase I [Pirellulaceae bacterium]